MAKYFVSYALHVPGEAGLDGFEKMKSADEFPEYDTLIGVKNTSRTKTAQLRIEFCNRSGTPVSWGADGMTVGTGKNYELKPNHSFAMTLIRPNPFPDTP